MATMGLGRTETLAEIQTMVGEVPGEKDKSYSNGDLIRLLFEATTTLGRFARRGRRGLFAPQLAEIFVWYIRLANHLGIDVHEAHWLKFPGACTYCLEEAKCLCKRVHPAAPPDKEERVRAFQLAREGREPRTLSEHQALNRRLYGERHRREAFAKVAAHIGEEVGELSKAEWDGDLETLEDEMADILSRILSFANRFDVEIVDVIRKSLSI